MLNILCKKYFTTGVDAVINVFNYKSRNFEILVKCYLAVSVMAKVVKLLIIVRRSSTLRRDRVRLK